VDDEGRLRLEYEQAAQLLRSLGETRLRLLALVPTAAGAVVALIGSGRTGVELLAIGGLGLVATFGLLAFELANDEVGAAVEERVRDAERTLLAGGPLAPARTPAHALGTACVYGAAIGGWSYLVAWGALRSLGAGAGAQGAGLALGAVAAVAAALLVLRREGAARGAPV
jgi:hypothetical protein